MGTWILAHDLGTSGDKATLYGEDGQLAASHVERYDTVYGTGGVAEQAPGDWWCAFLKATKALIEQSGVDPADIACITFSGQMMGCVVVDGKGEALRNAIIWADTRAKAEEAWFARQIPMERAYQIIGHRISASYSACKLLWIREHEADIYKRVYKMLNAKDYIIQKLCGVFCTDYSDASGTNLFDIQKKVWSQELLDALELSETVLPPAVASTEVVGHVSREAAVLTGLLEGTPVVIGGGDGSCACVGAGVVSEGSTYNVLGSSSWTSCASAQPVYDANMRTFNWVHLDEKLYTPCGTMQAAGNSFAWMRDTLCKGGIFSPEQSVYKQIDEAVLRSKPGANGLLFLPYLLGERAPRWNMDASGAFIGLRMNTRQEELCRSVLEGVGFNLKIILDILRDQICGIKEIILIGGGAQSRVWAQILSDIWETPLLIPRYLEEATSIGAAVCGGVGVGVFDSFSVISHFNPVTQVIRPNEENKEIYRTLYGLFDRSYDALCSVYRDLSCCQ